MDKMVKNGVLVSRNPPRLKEHDSENKRLEETAYLETDKSGNIICANNVLLNMLAKDAEEVLGQPLSNILPLASNNPKIFHYVWLGIQNEIIKKSDFILIAKNKKDCMIRFEIVLDMNPEKEIDRIIMVSNSISPVVEHKRYAYKSAQQALDEEEKRLTGIA